VRLMTMGSMSTSVPGQGCRMALARGVFIAKQLCSVGEVVVLAIFPFPYLKFFNREVTSSAVCVSDDSRFNESDEVEFVFRGSQR
jgi:hypothetical protein